MRKLVTQVSWVAVLLAVAAAAAGEEVAAVSAMTSINPANAPVRVTAIGVRKAASPDQLVALKFRIANTSDKAIRRIELNANLYGEKGQFSGFHSFTISEKLQPGEERYFHYSSADFEFEPGERVELVPAYAWGYNQEWAIERNGAGQGGQGHVSKPKAGPADTCDARCDTKDTVCSERCTCGVKEFSCSCGIGTFSYTCKCFACL